MTAYGFDLDGTLDRPGLVQLANDLYDAGHEVYVITGGFSDSGEWTAEARRQRLVALGVRCTEVVRCLDRDLAEIGRMKGRACQEHGVSVMFDDFGVYLTGVGETSTAVRLLVLP